CRGGLFAPLAFVCVISGGSPPSSSDLPHRRPYIVHRRGLHRRYPVVVEVDAASSGPCRPARALPDGVPPRPLISVGAPGPGVDARAGSLTPMLDAHGSQKNRVWAVVLFLLMTAGVAVNVREYPLLDAAAKESYRAGSGIP